MLKKICIFSILSISSVLSAVTLTWAIDLEPGKYEIIATVKMPAIASGMPPQVTTQCMNEQTPVPDAGVEGCKIIDMKTIGKTATYTMQCDRQGMKIKSTGKVTYDKNSFEGTTQTSMGPASGNMVITTVIKGKRIGKCD